jgi:hypothetical protein
MPNTPRIPIPYPAPDSNPWDTLFTQMVLAIDATTYCPREDRNIIIFGGGTMSWDAGTGVLSWTGEIDLFASVTGHLWGIAPGSVNLLDGQIFYITIARAPQNNAIYTPIVGYTTPNEPDGDDQLLIGLRKGSVVHFRNGMVILSGQSQNIFDSNGFNGSYVPPTGTGFVHITGGVQDAAARAVNLASNGVNGDVTGLLPWANGGRLQGIVYVTHTAPATLSPTTQIALVQSSTGTTLVTLPTTPTQGLQVAVLDTEGLAGTSNISVNTNGIPAENPNAPGTFVNGTITLQQNGSSVVWFYDQTENHWKVFSVFYTTAAGTAGGPLGPNPNWLVPNWYIDPSNVSGTASDNNNGTTAATALIHYRELVRRWGTVSPLLAQQTVLTFLSDQPDQTDPVILRPIMEPGSLLNVIGTPVTVASGSLGAVTAKNRATSTLLQANIGAAAAGSQGFMLFDTSQTARSFVDSVAGNVVTLTQPFAPSVTAPPAWWAGGASGSPAQVNSYTTGDSFQTIRLTKIYIQVFCPTTIGDWPASLRGTLAMLGQIWVPDPTNGAQSFLTNPTTRITECRIDSFFQAETTGSNVVAEQLFNSWLPNGGSFGLTSIYGGAINTISAGTAYLHGTVVGADALLHGTVLTEPADGTSQVVSLLDSVFLDGTLDVSSNVKLGNAPNYGAGGVLYGTYTVDAHLASFVFYDGTATGVFLGTPTLQINGIAKASAYDRSIDPGALHSGRTLSVAQLDATIASGGFGGVALGNGLDAGFLATTSLSDTSVPTPTPGGSGVAPLGPNALWSQANWFIDPSNVSGVASDSNTGADVSHPLLHFRELARRWGTIAPLISVSVTITFMSSQPDDTDRVFLRPYMIEGGKLYVIGTTTVLSALSGSLASVVAKNTTTTDGRWQATFVSDIHGDGRLIINTTLANSVAVVHNVGSGTTCGFSQPYTANLPASPTVPAAYPVQHNDWANGNNYQILQMPSVYIAEFLPQTIENDSVTSDNFCYVGRIFVPDPDTGSGNIGESTLFTNDRVSWIESQVNAAVQYTLVAQPSAFPSSINTSFAGAGGLAGIYVGGIFADPRAIGGVVGDGASFAGDPIVCTSLFVGSGAKCFIESLCFYGPSAPAGFFLQGAVFIKSVGSYSSFVVYGNYELFIGNSQDGAGVVSLIYQTTATHDLAGTVATSGILLDNVNLGIAEDTSSDPSLRHPGRALTPANIDASIATGGFGGVAYGYKGSVIAPFNYTPPASSGAAVISTAGGVLVLTPTSPTWILFIAGDVITLPNPMLVGKTYEFTHDIRRSAATLTTNPATVQRPGGATYTIEDPQNIFLAPGANATFRTDATTYRLRSDGAGVIRCVN